MIEMIIMKNLLISIFYFPYICVLIVLTPFLLLASFIMSIWNLNKKEVKVKLKKRGKEVSKAEELINNVVIRFPLKVKSLSPLLMTIKE